VRAPWVESGAPKLRISYRSSQNKFRFSILEMSAAGLAVSCNHKSHNAFPSKAPGLRFQQPDDDDRFRPVNPSDHAEHYKNRSPSHVQPRLVLAGQYTNVSDRYEFVTIPHHTEHRSSGASETRPIVLCSNLGVLSGFLDISSSCAFLSRPFSANGSLWP
jgi:hypothetical protein